MLSDFLLRQLYLRTNVPRLWKMLFPTRPRDGIINTHACDVEDPEREIIYAWYPLMTTDATVHQPMIYISSSEPERNGGQATFRSAKSPF